MINNLEKAIRTELLKHHPRVYSENAPNNATFPYLVFSLSSTLKDGPVETVDIYVDGWDKPTNGTPVALNTLMTKLEAIDRTTATTGDVVIHFNLESRESMDDPNKLYKYKRYSFSARVFRKE